MKRIIGKSIINELEGIKNMLERSSKYHLQEEVILSFYYELKVNPKIELLDEIYNALYEWDV